MIEEEPRIRPVLSLAARAADGRDWLLIKLQHPGTAPSRIAIPAAVVSRFIEQLRDVCDELQSQQRAARPHADDRETRDCRRYNGDDDACSRPQISRGDWQGAFCGAPFVRAYNHVAMMIVGHVEDSSEAAFMLPPEVAHALLDALETSRPELMDRQGH